MPSAVTHGAIPLQAGLRLTTTRKAAQPPNHFHVAQEPSPMDGNAAHGFVKTGRAAGSGPSGPEGKIWKPTVCRWCAYAVRLIQRGSFYLWR